MQIILLSGGSGKRLWPLSNDVRSKQFIPFFRDNDGSYISMVQRVFKQIKRANSDVHVTIATNSAQKSAIVNQLGKSVSICVEPERRDTFPAISLAGAYLRDKLRVDLNETVVVCPVDPYVEESYFAALMDLDKLVQQGKRKLTLMGIEPTYASEKYGYIIPRTKDKVSEVSEFKEKPDKSHAESFIKQGALWNAGIFAFKLSYILDFLQKDVGFHTYDGILSHYTQLAKTSFDYAVVENESSINVQRYAGQWRDVGTWNMITEVMPDLTKGQAILDDYCQNTHVINELNLPIIAMGLKNVVIAASGDGILVADKERSGYMKPLVNKVGNTVNFAEKSWGDYKVIHAEPHSLTVSLTLKKGHKLSYQLHHLRDEAWVVTAGEGTAIMNGVSHHLKPGCVLSIPRGTKHTLIANSNMSVIETQVGDDVNASDKVVISQ